LWDTGKCATENEILAYMQVLLLLLRLLAVAQGSVLAI